MTSLKMVTFPKGSIKLLVLLQWCDRNSIDGLLSLETEIALLLVDDCDEYTHKRIHLTSLFFGFFNLCSDIKTVILNELCAPNFLCI